MRTYQHSKTRNIDSERLLPDPGVDVTYPLAFTQSPMIENQPIKLTVQLHAREDGLHVIQISHIASRRDNAIRVLRFYLI